MNDKTKNKLKPAQLLFIVFFFAYCAFAVFYPISPRIVRTSYGPFSETAVGAFSGAISGLTILFSALMIIVIPRRGMIFSVIANNILLFSALGGCVMGGSIKGNNAFTGVILSIATIITSFIINHFYCSLDDSTRALNKKFEELKEANKVIEENEQKLTYLAYYDILTGLPNSQMFSVKLDETILGEYNSPFTIIIANVDNFKYLNETYGNSTGDSYLCRCADGLKAFCDERNILIARTGGDEFSFLLQGKLDDAGIITYAQKFQSIINENIQFSNEVVPITSSLGAASFPDDAANSADLLKCANNAISFAKMNGRNRIFIYKK